MEGIDSMKLVKVVAVVAALGLAAGGYAIVQSHHGARGHHQHVQMDGAELVGHLGKVFGQFAAFDVNKDGQLDAAEKGALGKAIASGALSLPGPTPAKEAFPSEEARLDHFAAMFAKFAVYDVNHDGELDATELGAVQAAIENGALNFPGAMKNGGGANMHQLGKSLHSW